MVSRDTLFQAMGNFRDTIAQVKNPHAVPCFSTILGSMEFRMEAISRSVKHQTMLRRMFENNYRG
jgi:hypothetical protein